MVTKIGVSRSLRYYESLANRKSIQELLRYTGYENIRIECTEVNWLVPNLKTIVVWPNLRNFLFFAIKVLDKSTSRLVEYFRSGYFFVCKAESSERKEPLCKIST